MTFRDDHDAALARVDALEREVGSLTEERDALARERDELRDERDALRTERDALARRARPPRRKLETWQSYALIGAPTAVALVLIVVLAVTCDGGRKREPGASTPAGPDAAPAANRRQVDDALVDLRRCTALYGVWVRYRAAMGAEEVDPRKRTPGPDLGEQLSHLTEPKYYCEPHTRAITGSRSLPDGLRASVAAWFDAAAALAAIAAPLSAYYVAGDFADDDAAFARAEWPKLQAAMKTLEERRRAIDVGAIEAALDARAGGDPTVDLLRAIDRAIWAGLGETASAEQLRTMIADLIAMQTVAPLEVRRASRELPAGLERAAAESDPIEIGAALIDARFTVQARSSP